ncbi:MAG TPA: DUF2238 domain-containing protein [Verrucomicrobiales bacterium]|jgi:putative membrane protein|nr:DUF2238 domain-containing protein [Verrucomicrobiales bacterium]
MTELRRFSSNRFLHVVLAVYAVIWLITAWRPVDFPTWAIENLLVVVFIGVLWVTCRKFTFTNLSYLLMAIFLALHAIGAHTGYARSPAGYWLQSVFHLERNPYDRLIHCAFGLLLAYPVHELLARAGGIRNRAGYWLPVAVITAVSAFFEIVEAVVAEIISPGTGPAWLGAQGDQWDAQMDMGVAFLGSAAAMFLTYFRNRGSIPHARSSPLPNVVPFRRRRLLQGLIGAYAAIFVIAAIKPVDRSDWLLESLLVFVAVPVLVLTYRRFPLSNATYVLAFLFLVLHTAGAHYRYADVPLGYWLQNTFSLTRNHFDRIVHLSYGLLLTWPACEILVRACGLRGFWAGAMPPMLIVAISGLFEILEALVAAIVEPELGAAYLGIQGDVWDAQQDMALALAGTIPAVVVFAMTRPAWYPADGKCQVA